MKRFVSVATAFGVLVSLSGFALARADDAMKAMPGMAPMGTMVKITAQNDSGESGTATLTPSASGLIVKLDLTGGSGDQPAHIHKGTCAKLDPKPAYPLTTVSDGKSTTTIPDLKLSTLAAGAYAINVHKSTTDLKDYVACGDIKVAAK